MTRSIRHALNFVFVLGMFTLLTGARGCTTTTSTSTYTSPPPSGGGTVVVGPSNVGPAAPAIVYAGDLALTVYAPLMSSTTPDTESFVVTVRAGGAFGPVVIEASDFHFDYDGVGAVDITALEYGFYDVEVVGLDFFGNAVSHAAAGVTIQDPLTYTSLELEPVVFAGDVVLELFEPDGGAYGAPIDTIDYVLWELDPQTGEYVFVEEMVELPFAPWEPPVVGGLELGRYFIEVYAFDVYGYWMYEFSGEFTHQADLTYAQIGLWYAD